MLFSSISSQTATHKTGIPISALDVSPQRTHAVLAGREILKTIRVSGAICAEEFNLRAAIIAYASTHNAPFAGSSVRYKDDLASNDVKWSHGNYSSTIATAAANGRIVLYDINRAGVQLARVHEHNRQVHKLAFNPHQGYYLLSGSQDATLRLWDLRAMAGGRNVLTFRSTHKYKANADGIRDVKWSPTDGTVFACGSDAGIVQRWDFRRDNAPTLKIHAHSQICKSIDWHPDGKHLVSGGYDKMIIVWDFSSNNRRQNPPWSINTPQNVTNVRWRPGEWSTNVQGLAAWETTQVVTSYNVIEPRVHIWNFRHPSAPFKEVDRYNTAPTDMLWYSGDLLWTVGPEGIFTQTDIHFAPKLHDRRNLQSFDLAGGGELGLSVYKKAQRQLGFDDHSDVVFVEHGKQARVSGVEKLSGSRSTTDDEVSGNLLGTSVKIRHARTWSSRPSKSPGTTPPSEPGSFTVRKLDEILSKRAVSPQIQLAASGDAFPSFPSRMFIYLAKTYQISSVGVRTKSSKPYHERVQQMMERNAILAEFVGCYRTAQTWRMLSLVVAYEVLRRAEHRRQLRLEQKAREIEDSSIPLAGNQTTDVVSRKSINGTITSRYVGMIPGLSGSPSTANSLRQMKSKIGIPHLGPSYNHRKTQQRLPLRLEPLQEYVPEPSTPHNKPINSADRFGTPLTLPSLQVYKQLKASSTGRGSSEPDMLLSRFEPEVPNQLRSSDGDESSMEHNIFVNSQSDKIASDVGDFKERSDQEAPPSLQQAKSTEVESDPIDQASTYESLDHTNNATLEPLVLKEDFIPDDWVCVPEISSTEFPTLHAFNTATMLNHVLDFYVVNLADTLTPSHLIFYLQQFIARNSVNQRYASSIFNTYHSQLLSRGLFLQAAEIRNLCCPKYEAVYDASLDEVDIKLICPGCRARILRYPSVREKRRRAWICEKCAKTPAPCPLCRSNLGRGWWAWCQGCGHGGHETCLRSWWADSRTGGACMVQGCTHECFSDDLSILRKRAKLRIRAKEKAPVRWDEWVVGESKAVERLRGKGVGAGGVGLPSVVGATTG